MSSPYSITVLYGEFAFVVVWLTGFSILDNPYIESNAIIIMTSCQ